MTFFFNNCCDRCCRLSRDIRFTRKPQEETVELLYPPDVLVSVRPVLETLPIESVVKPCRKYVNNIKGVGFVWISRGMPAFSMKKKAKASMPITYSAVQMKSNGTHDFVICNLQNKLRIDMPVLDRISRLKTEDHSQ